MGVSPVNCPSIAAVGNDAIVALDSAANDVPKLQGARSTDAGDSFAAHVVVHEGEAVQGRPDVALDDKQAWVAWLREDARGQSLWLERYAPALSRELQRKQVAARGSSSRRDMLCQYVWIAGVAVSLNKTNSATHQANE